MSYSHWASRSKYKPARYKPYTVKHTKSIVRDQAKQVPLADQAKQVPFADQAKQVLLADQVKQVPLVPLIRPITPYAVPLIRPITPSCDEDTESDTSETESPRLFDHQIKSVAYLSEMYTGGQPCAYLNMPMGSGKTRITIEFVNRFPLVTLFITPPNVVMHIEAEVLKWARNPELFTITDPRNIHKYETQPFQLLVIDECHLLIAKKSVFLTKACTIQRKFTILLSGNEGKNDIYWKNLFSCKPMNQAFRINNIPEIRPVQVRVRRLNLSTEQHAEYKRLMEIYANSSNKTVVFKEMREKLANWKFNFIRDFIQERQHESMVITSEFPSVLIALQMMMPKKTSVINSSIPKEQRAAIIGNFNSGLLTQIFAVTSFITHGIDLTACTCLLAVEPLFEHTNEEQLHCRLQRIGQTSRQQCFIVLLFADTLEERLFRVNKSFQEVEEDENEWGVTDQKREPF